MVEACGDIVVGVADVSGAYFSVVTAPSQSFLCLLLCWALERVTFRSCHARFLRNEGFFQPQRHGAVTRLVLQVAVMWLGVYVAVCLRFLCLLCLLSSLSFKSGNASIGEAGKFSFWMCTFCFLFKGVAN